MSLALLQCGVSDSSRSVDGVILLEYERVVVHADTTTATAWIGSLSMPTFDSIAGHILAMDRQSHAVDEFTPEGKLIYRYGARTGSGPGEVRDATGYAWNRSALYILDNRNRRITVFDRSGNYLSSFRLQRGYNEIAMLGSDRIVLMPGSDSAAFDFYRIDGEFIGARGRLEDLPKCVEDACDLTSWECFDCSLAVIGDSIITVAEGITPQLAFFDTAGAKVDSVSFASLDFMNDWKVESTQRIRDHDKIRRANSLEFKSFFANVSDMGGGRLSLAIIPARSYLRAHGHELWIFKPFADPEEIVRYGYSSIDDGFSAVVNDTTVFAVSGGDVKQYAFPRAR